jgi:hypothetical protein
MSDKSKLTFTLHEPHVRRPGDRLADVPDPLGAPADRADHSLHKDDSLNRFSRADAESGLARFLPDAADEGKAELLAAAPKDPPKPKEPNLGE